MNITPLAPRNFLLAGLSKKDSVLLAGLETVGLEARQILEAPGIEIPYVYFVESGLVSVVGASHPNHRIEVAMVGFEGMSGAAVVLGADRSANESIVQSRGEARRIATGDLMHALGASASMREAFLRYVHVFTMQCSQTALANGRGNLQERLARWIVMWQDRLQADDITVTHQFLSLLLGVRRAGVTGAIHLLESKSLIRASRALITILDREGLLRAANGFYGVAEAEYERLVGRLPVPVASAAWSGSDFFWPYGR